jgi:hypothetical protein
MRLTFYAAIVFVILQQPAYSIDRLKCGGTEPFWDAQLSDGQVVFDPSGGGERRIIYRAPLYRAAAGAPLDFVMSVRAKRGNSTLIGFVVNENRMIVADKNGKAPSDADAYSAYCSDGMSDRGYSFSIHLIVDGNAYTGCCSTAALPPVGSD